MSESETISEYFITITMEFEPYPKSKGTPILKKQLKVGSRKLRGQEYYLILDNGKPTQLTLDDLKTMEAILNIARNTLENRARLSK